MQGLGDGSNNSFISQDLQRQYQRFSEWLNEGRPRSLLSQLAQPGISSEDQRNIFLELMTQVDPELTSRGIGFQRTNPENGQIGNGPLMVQQGNISNNALITGNLDLNANDGPMMQPGLTLNPPGGPEAPAGAHSSNPIFISSEAYGLEIDGDGGRGHGASSSNGNRPSFNRMAPEYAPRKLLLGESSGTVHQPEDVVAHGNASTVALNNHGNVANQIGLLEAGGVYSVNQHEPQNFGAHFVVNHQTGAAASTLLNQASIRPRQAEAFQRNIRLRRNPNLQDFTPATQLTQTPTNSPSPSAMFFFPHDHFVNSRAQPVHLTPASQYVQVSEPFQNQHVQVQVPGQGVTTSSGAAGGRPAHTQLQGNLSPMAENMNMANGNTNFPRNTTAASSQDPSNSSSGISAVPIWYPDQAIRYSNRMLEILRSVENRGLQVDYRPVNATGPAVAAAAAPDMETTVGGGSTSTRPRLRLRRTRLMPRAGTQDADHPDISRRGQPAMVSEVHNSLTLVRSGGGLRFEDVTVINRSVLIGLPEYDVHRDMRLDIDNMSYEELIALSDEIGNVSTGLREDAIFAKLRVQLYESFGVEYPDNTKPSCCICQEEYVNGEYLGKLDCEHDFHANCIKKWLAQKNKCPICKKTGLAA